MYARHVTGRYSIAILLISRLSENMNIIIIFAVDPMHAIVLLLYICTGDAFK